MTKSISILFILLFGVAANADNGIYTLTVKINTSQKMPIYVAIYKNETSFLKLDKATLKKRFSYNENNMYVIGSLQEGNYAISIFQDINGNGELDTSFIGIPKEPYGFSNNVIGMFGAPSFSDCNFSMSSNMTMVIMLK